MTHTGMPETGIRTGRLLAVSLLCCLLFALAACGQRGPLYLPDDKPAAGNSQEEPETSEKEDEEETSRP